jgi:hypothetical protein
VEATASQPRAGSGQPFISTLEKFADVGFGGGTPKRALGNPRKIPTSVPPRNFIDVAKSVLSGLDNASKPETKGDRPWSPRENVRSFTGKDKDGNTITGGILVVPDKPEDFYDRSKVANTLNIKFVYSGEGRGGGRLAMQKTIEQADKNRATLSLSVAPFENPLKASNPNYRGLDISRLKTFYESLGFRTADGSARKDYDPSFSIYMERKPRG